MKNEKNREERNLFENYAPKTETEVTNAESSVEEWEILQLLWGSAGFVATDESDGCNGCGGCDGRGCGWAAILTT